MDKKKFFTATKALDKSSDEGLWFVATCEVPDTVGDVVKADGVDYSDYHNPPKSYLKILAGHEHMLADGSPAIIGRAEEFLRADIIIDGKSVPALYVRMTWAKDGDGTVTELAQKYKSLYDGGYLDSFSVGMMVKEFQKNKTGGVDIIKSSLYEVSAVAIPCLSHANAVKTIEETLGITLELPTDKVEETHLKEMVSGEVLEAFVAKYFPNGVKAVDAEPYDPSVYVRDSIAKALEPALESLNSIAKSHKDLLDRLDVLESAIVVLTANAKGLCQDNRNDPSPDQKKQFNETLDRLNKFLGK